MYSDYVAAVGEENSPSIRILLARGLAAVSRLDVERHGKRVHVHVHPVVRPEPDLRKLAHALCELA
ncbi:hypothetical protein [Frigoribacterium sp. MCBA15_019]|uniref:hypothetical protein n=1 Tax=Frigoribacterium sp. MCBA15_019 TaxID=1898745 RepID=UPI00115F8D11|nr:hypothetical protein [Frigoribacterium sp. MCBA15_019]